MVVDGSAAGQGGADAASEGGATADPRPTRRMLQAEFDGAADCDSPFPWRQSDSPLQRGIAATVIEQDVLLLLLFSRSLRELHRFWWIPSGGIDSSVRLYLCPCSRVQYTCHHIEARMCAANSVRQDAAASAAGAGAASAAGAAAGASVEAPAAEPAAEPTAPGTSGESVEAPCAREGG